MAPLEGLERRAVHQVLLGVAGLLVTLGAVPALSAPRIEHVSLSAHGELLDGVELAANGRGDAVAVWDRVTEQTTRTSTYAFAIEAAVKPAGRAWQKAVKIGSAVGYYGEEVLASPTPAVAIGPRGDVAVEWLSSQDGRPTKVLVAVRPMRGTWRKPVLVASGASEPPAVAVDSHGNTIVVWAGFRASPIAAAEAVDAVFEPAGQGWRKPVPLSGFLEYPSTPQVAFDGHGDAIAVWDRVGNYVPDQTIQFATMPAGRAWDKARNIAGVSEPGLSELAVNAHGTALLAWGDGRVHAAFGSTAGGWTQPVPVGAAPTVQEPQVALDERGDAMVAWVAVRSHPETARVITADKPVGQPWGKAETLPIAAHAIPDPQFDYDVHPRIALDRHGNAIAVWSTFRGAKVAYRPAGRGWEKPITLCTGKLADACASPAIALGLHGGAIAVWVRKSVVQALTLRPTGLHSQLG